MRIVVAPDSYKGSLSATAVCNAMEEGIHSVFPNASIRKLPIADGGEGTMEALVSATGGKLVHENVLNPLGESVDSFWGILGDNETGVIELAAASGLMLVAENKRDPLITTSYGTGQLIKAALNRGLRKLIIGIGGSATNDGGMGMLQALGVKFLDAEGKELPFGGNALARLDRIDPTGLDSRVAETQIIVACDVNNPLCGPQGASAIYGPQKGATIEMVEVLDRALSRYEEVARKTTGKDVANVPGAGAAGGFGAGLLFFTDAVLRPGVQIVLEAVGFESMLKETDIVFTGEGCTDYQTVNGKAPVGVARIASAQGVPTICISGSLGFGYEEVYSYGINATMSIVPGPMPLEQCLAQAHQLIGSSAARACLLIKAGKKLT